MEPTEFLTFMYGFVSGGAFMLALTAIVNKVGK